MTVSGVCRCLHLQRRAREAVFLSDSIPGLLGPAGYSLAAGIGVAFIPLIYSPGELWRVSFGLLHEQRLPTQCIRLGLRATAPVAPRVSCSNAPQVSHVGGPPCGLLRVLLRPSVRRMFEQGADLGTRASWGQQQWPLCMQPVPLLPQALPALLLCCAPVSCLADDGLQHAGTWS